METVLDVMIEIRDGLKEKGLFHVPAERVAARIRELDRQKALTFPGSVEEYGVMRSLAELNGLLSK